MRKIAQKLGIASFCLSANLLPGGTGYSEVQPDSKMLVERFYRTSFVDHEPRKAAEAFLDESYIQHNPQVATGRKAFIDYFEPFFAKNPQATAKIVRVIASGDLVFLHVHAKVSEEDRGSAIVDIFRVKDGKIVEHWDVIQPIPEKSANANGMF